jgi:hypothetical protein
MATLTAALCSSCFCVEEEPCVPWVELQERYRVELVAPVEEYATEEPFPASYPGRRTCGPVFDLVSGDAIELTPVGKQGSQSGHGCTCYYAEARTVVPGIEFVVTERDRPVSVDPRRRR